MDPLAQFQVKRWITLGLGSLDISLTNASFFMLLAAFLPFLFWRIAIKKQTTLVPQRAGAFFEMIYLFIRNLMVAPEKKIDINHFSIIFSMFLFVLLGNLLGMIPFAFTFTSQIISMLALGCLFFVFLLILGVMKHGRHIIRLFAPPGLPPLLYLILVPIEIFSFVMKPVSLSIRLFANMVAGHAMLKVFAGFCVGASLWVGTIPVLINVIMFGFECFVACLQAYVFALLTTLYLHEVLHLL